MSPEHQIADTDTRRRAQVRKQALEHAVGRGAQVKAWVMVNGTGEARHGGALFVVACDLCPVARSGYDTGELTAWWREHYPTHAVEVSTDGQRDTAAT